MAFSLQFDPSWRYRAPDVAPVKLVNELYSLIAKISVQSENQQSVLELFKTHFAGAAGTVSHRSSGLGWAQSDLDMLMREAAENAPLFIEAFFEACETLKRQGLHTPDVGIINSALNECDANYRIVLPHLIRLDEGRAPVVVAAPSPTLDIQAQEVIQKSLKDSQDYLAVGKYREAVQEIMWLLESVATLFQGLPIGEDTITGKYFNVIADELREAGKGGAMHIALTTAKTIHGYLSSPTGGGVRHGANLKAGITLTENEARLFCNLTRSYIDYLLGEHKAIEDAQRR